VPDPIGESFMKKVASPLYFEEPNHIRIFSHDDFKSLFDKVNLQIDDHDTFGAFWNVAFSLLWAGDSKQLGPPWSPLVKNWAKVWSELSEHPQGYKVKELLDDSIPKSQVIIATK
jgi:hypothetical protein